ncbi:hypothetical protein MMC25_006216 [Agyrium rufum]|nr:hypothetical protein [Agyrium rufum]
MYFQKPFPTKTSTLSFWRTDLSDIDELRTTEDLPTACDVVIVGAGLSGASTAYHLLANGIDPPLSITLLEARQVCSGATGRNGGHSKLGWQNVPETCKSFGIEKTIALTDFFLAQIPALKDVVEKEGIECDFALRRSFNVFYDEAAVRSTRAAFENYKDIPYAQQVDFVEEKYLDQVTRVTGAKGAIGVPACSFWPYKLVCGLLKVALRRGLNLQTNTYVTSVSPEPSSDGFFRIQTPRGCIKARKVLFATNGYTGAISLEYANVIVPWKGVCSQTVVNSNDGLKPNLSNTYNLHNTSGNPEYINPRPDGSIIVGGGKDTFEKDYSQYWNNHDDSTLIEPAKHYFDNYVPEHFTDYASLDTSVKHIWSGGE